MSILPSFLEELSNIDIAESEETKVIEGMDMALYAY